MDAQRRIAINTLIDNGRLQLLEVLGAGAFGTVYRAHDRNCFGSPTFRAVKVMPKVTDPNSERGKLLERECTHHHYVSGHPNIVKLHRVAHDSRFVYVILDYVSGGDLLSLIIKHRAARNDDLIRSILIQLVDAMYACHQNNIYHRDMKPENILINEDMSRVFLSDFGLSTRSSGRSYMFRVGTANYMSPECYNVHGDWDDYDLRRNDIWAIGMIAVCMIAGRCPWRRPSMKDVNFSAYVEDQRYLRAVLPISEEADEIFRSIFTLREEDCIDLLTLRELLTNVKTFYMTEEEFDRATPSARELYDLYDPRSQMDDGTTLVEDSSSSVYLSASGETSESEYSNEREASGVPRPVLDIAPGACSRFVNESELPTIAEEDSPAPPPFDAPPLPDRPITLGQSESCSSSEFSDLSSEEESEGPITPETHAQDPDVTVPDLSEGAGLGEQAVKVDYQPFEKARRSLTGPQFRILSGLVESVSRMLTTV
ncbi:kinase-like protein [Daedalea quercina L-15889]|uniref:non-specific serine/threonine protein kinase n=1 Tax=Daedalea quercina L-15889 TaxID=1314783 RepID=A0A165N6E0_9APHY|nr:kinase-like protein [Daedalea quercina L-15889]